MSRRSWLLLGVLSSLWGASYLFIKVALEDDMSPTVVVFVRCMLAAAVLLPLAARAGALPGLRANVRHILVLSVVQMGAPLLLIAFGERHIPSSLTGILVATAPIFTFLLAFGLEGEERATGLSLGGVVIGIAGVAMLLGVDTGGGFDALAGGLMVVLASCLAFVIFYSLVASDGPARASLVGYIAPGFSIVYGVTLLDEGFRATTAVGLVLILGGSWLAAEGRPPWARRAIASVPDPGTVRA